MRMGWWGTVATLVAAIPAQAADGNHIAYDFAMRCFTAGAVAINRASENPKGMNTGAIREKAKHAHDVAYQMGTVLGMTPQQVSDDFDHVQAAEARLLTSQPSYYARTKADCIKLGLM